jgi:hypothetical protein
MSASEGLTPEVLAELVARKVAEEIHVPTLTALLRERNVSSLSEAIAIARTSLREKTDQPRGS